MLGADAHTPPFDYDRCILRKCIGKTHLMKGVIWPRIPIGPQQTDEDRRFLICLPVSLMGAICVAN